MYKGRGPRTEPSETPTERGGGRKRYVRGSITIQLVRYKEIQEKARFVMPRDESL